MFRVGQKVVCVIDFANEMRLYPAIIFPSKNQIYTVRDITDIGNEAGLRVTEFINALMQHSNYPDPIEPAFALTSFRPIVERKTDISIFTEMLTGGRIDA